MSIENSSFFKKNPFTYLNFDVLENISSYLSIEDLRNVSMVSKSAHEVAKSQFSKRHIDTIKQVTAFFVNSTKKMVEQKGNRVKPSSKLVYDFTQEHEKKIEELRDRYIKKVRSFPEERLFGLQSFLGFKSDMCFNLFVDINKRFSINLEETPEIFRKYFFKETGFTKEAAQFLLTLDPNLFSLFSSEFQGDKDIALLACSLKRGNLTLAKAPFSEDIPLLLQMIKSDEIAPWPSNPKFFYESMLHFFSKEARKTEEVVLELLKKNGPANLYYADKSLKSSPDFLLKVSALSQAPVLKYASAKIRSNVSFTRVVCESYPSNLNHLHMSLLSKKEFAYKAVSYNPQNLKKVIGACSYSNKETLLFDEDLALIALKQDLSLLSFTVGLNSNRAFVFRVAAEVDPKIFPYVSSALQSDISFCDELVDKHPENLTFMPNEYIKLKLSENGVLLRHLSEEQREDVFYVFKAVQSNPSALQYASDKLRESPSFIFGISKKLKFPFLPFLSSSFRSSIPSVVNLVNIEPSNSRFIRRALYEFVFPKLTFNQAEFYFNFIVEGIKKDKDLFHLLADSIRHDPITLLKLQEQNLDISF